MVTIGPGTRLLCVEVGEAAENVGLQLNRTYTCREVFPAVATSFCTLHDRKDCDGVWLSEISHPRHPIGIMAFCLRQFVPLEGSLPAEITRCLEIEPPVTPKVLEPA